MELQSELSRRQLELQARIARQRIEAIERILKSGVQPPASKGLDQDTKEVIARLYDTSLSEADISSCISILEMLLLLDGLQPLLSVMKSETYPMSLRQQAAKAISVIGVDYLANDLAALRSSALPELRALALIALGAEKPER